MSVWEKYLPESRVRWSSDHWQTPIWPTEPDLSVIKTIVASEMFKDGDHREDPDLQVRFLADGANHKVYEATHPSWTTAYLLRVAVPLDPCLKMESEMATLAFLRKRTTIPVPKPIAWNSDANNELGYEWALVEKIPGVELEDVWRTMPWDEKLALSRELATYMSQMWHKDNRFDQIGSIYLTDGTTGIAPRHVHLDDISDPSFNIGPAIDNDFFTGRRRFLSLARGPFKTEKEWMEALIEAEREVIKTGKILLDARDEAPEEYKDDEAWEDLVGDESNQLDEEALEHYDTLMANCETFMEFLPKLFREKSPISHFTSRHDALDGDISSVGNVIFHRDLSTANILVDPDTFKITGIIDWESTAVQPAWYGFNYPSLIDREDWFSDKEPKIPTTYDEDSDDYNCITVDDRDRWETKILRGAFDAQLQQLGYPSNWKAMSPREDLRYTFLCNIGHLSGFSGDWESAQSDIKKLNKKWEEMEKKREELKALFRGEQEAKLALSEQQHQELRELVAKHAEQYEQLEGCWEEKTQGLIAWLGKKERT